MNPSLEFTHSPSLCARVAHLSLLVPLSGFSLEVLVGFSLGDPTIFLKERDLIRVIAWKAKRSWRS